MSFRTAGTARSGADGGPELGIVRIYMAHLQALGCGADLIGQCIRTILHLVTWLSATGTAIETLDIRVLHRFMNHDYRCPGPRGCHRNPGRARRHLHRFLGFLIETGRARMPLEIETGSRMLESFLRTLVAQGYVQESIAAYRMRCRHFVVWLYLHDIALSGIDDDVLSRFLSHECTCAHPHFFKRNGRFVGASKSRSKTGAFIDYLIGRGAVPPRPAPAREEPGRHMTRFPIWLRRYRGLEDGTVEGYIKAMQGLLPHLGDDPGRYDATLIRNTVLRRLGTASRDRVRHEMLALRWYLRFLALNGLCRPELVSAVPTVALQRFSTLPRHLPREDIEAIIASCDRTTPKGLRDRAILLLLARLALRAGDVAGLRWSDIDWNNAVVRVSGKSRRATALPLPQDVGDAVKDYILHARPVVDVDKVFLRSAAPSVHADNGDLCAGRCPDASGGGPALAGCRRRRMTLTEHVQSYIAFHRILGHAYTEPARRLRDYAAYAESRGDSFVRSSTVLDWASTTRSPRQARTRLRYVCDFASVLHADDERHEVPDRDALGKLESRRPSPRLLSTTEIGRVMAAALELPPAGSITPLTFHYKLGLMAATGLRRSEATGLLLTDLTTDGLLIRNAKFGKRRLVPLDDSVHRAMGMYLQERRRSGGPDEHLFVLSTGRPVHPSYLTGVFIKLLRRVGLRGGPGEPGPRLHDLRHSFAVRALEGTLPAGRRDVGRHMLALSTYLGHSNTSDTYWYLEATPVLLRQVPKATERLHEGRRSNG